LDLTQIDTKDLFPVENGTALDYGEMG